MTKGKGRMKREITAIVLTILCFGMLIPLFHIHPVKAGVITVPDQYSTIQAAVNAASPGDTIQVRNGTYNEDVIVNKTGLHVVGESINGTIIDASGLDPAEGPRTAFYVDADLVEITGFHLRCTDGFGVALYGPNCSISGNGITSDTDSGIISTMLSDNASITNNIIYAFNRGIHLNDTRFNIVDGNLIAGSMDGIFSNDLAIGQGNVVTDNTIMSNEYGVSLLQTRANATTFYHNNFIGNTYQVDVTGTIQPTAWDDGYPSGGNCWSDYTGTDLYHGPFQNETGSDGVGDAKYHIIWSNIVNLTDNYPLMGNFSRLQSDATPAFTQSCISNSTVSGFQSHGATISFDISGEPGTTGFCTLTILHSTLAPPYTVQVDGSSVPYTTVFENDTLSTIYFTYQHSTHEVTITGFSATIIVPDQYPTIQAAINAANPGDTVFVRNGTYFENVVVNKTLSLVGESREKTIVDGRPPAPAYGAAILIVADGVSVNSLTTANDIIGIWVTSSNNIISENNIVNSSGIGVYVNGSSNTLERNYVDECIFQGIQLAEAYDNSLFENTIEYCHQGLAINFSSYNTATQNIIRNNVYSPGDGIFLTLSPFNILTENTVTANSHGVGIAGSNDSSFYHNNFNNTYQVYDYAGHPSYVGLPTSHNTWNDSYPLGGNYWSDYNGVDAKRGPNEDQPGTDGIGDTPYIIDLLNKDNYPLMGTSSTVNDISTVSNSTISNVHLNGTAITVDVSGQHGTTGFCTLTILHSTLPPPYTVTVDGNPIPYTTLFENVTMSIIYFTYEHSTHRIAIFTEATWPMFRYDLAHTGNSPSKAPDTNQTLWNYTTSQGVLSSPAVADGKVYVGSTDGRVYALNASTGTQIWNYTTGDTIWSSSPAVADGKVFIGSYDYKVYCLDASDGTLIWNYTTNDRVDSSPAVADGRVFVASEDTKVYALDESDGSSIWNYTTGSSVRSSPAVADGKVFIGSYDGKTYALNASTGTQIWNYTTSGWLDSSPAIADGKVFIGSRDQKAYALDESNGTLVWNYTTSGWVESSPAVADGKVFVGSDDNNLYALNASTGTWIWNYTTGNYVRSSPAVADGKVFIGSGDQKAYALDESSGALVWNYTTSGWVESSPAVADGKVFIGSNDRKIYAFGPLLGRDVGAISVVLYKTVVGQGLGLNMTVTVSDLGGYRETFSITVYANTTSVASQSVTLSSGTSTTILFTWNTTSFAYSNYTISAYAWPVPGETNTLNNNCTGGTTKVTIPGDINGDFKCSLSDLSLLAKAFNTKPGDAKWNPNADINGNGNVGLSDLSIMAKHFNQHYP